MIKRIAFLLLFAAVAIAQGRMDFTLSIEQPAKNTFHMTLRCDGLKGEMNDFKMPAWMPGFYGLQDYARFVSSFRAADAAGKPLAWEKVTKNTWRVITAGAAAVTLDYDVAGTRNFPASSLLSESRAYLAPPGTYLHLAGQLQRPATVAVKLPAGWSRIATGLDPVPGKPNTYAAPDFDLLYDSPLLAGNQESLSFTVNDSDS